MAEFLLKPIDFIIKIGVLLTYSIVVSLILI